MEIIAVDPVGKQKCKITFDNYEKIVLYHKEAARYRIEVGGFLKEDHYEEILREILLPRAKKRVLYLLQTMDRTEVQLRQKLQEGFFPKEIIDTAIAYGKSYHYIDDQRYAGNYVHDNMGRKSRRMVAVELERKGVSREYIDEMLENVSEDQEREIVSELIRKRRLSPKEEDPKVILKVKQYLLRKGFPYEMIEDVMRQYLK